LKWGQVVVDQQEYSEGFIPVEKWPDFLKGNTRRFANPSWIFVSTGQNGKKFMVKIEYAGGLGQRGIAIVPSKEEVHGARGSLFIPWVDGVYVYSLP